MRKPTTAKALAVVGLGWSSEVPAPRETVPFFPRIRMREPPP